VSLTLALLAVLAGLLLLAGGGELLVRGAVAIARLAGLTTALIGLTVVAMGTSIPELVVSLIAALGGTPDIAMGNVIGSNLANVGLILGLSALLVTLPIHGTAATLEWPFMFVASSVAVLLARDLTIDRLEGGFFVVALVLFLAFMTQQARTGVQAEERTEIAGVVEARWPPRGSGAAVAAAALVLVGIAALVLGGRLLVDGAVSLARYAGVTERVIGLTVVAVGTSMPELAASLVAALRRHADVAIANIIGSNIFNILGILGTTALVQPVRVAPEMVTSDLWWMLGLSLLLYPFLRHRRRLDRLEGAVLLGAYIVYIALLL